MTADGLTELWRSVGLSRVVWCAVTTAARQWILAKSLGRLVLTRCNSHAATLGDFAGLVKVRAAQYLKGVRDSQDFGGFETVGFAP